MIKSIRGTRDLLPPETETWNRVESATREVFRAFNFHEIRTPVIEPLELFQRSVGEDTDIVSKEMFAWWEGRTAPHQMLIHEWIRLHRAELDDYAIEPRLPGKHHIDVLGRAGGNTIAVEAKTRGDRATIEQLLDFGRQWLLDEPARPRMILAIPKGSPSSQLREFAERAHVEIEEIDLEILDYEAPQQLALRPENTAGVVRAYIEHKLWERPGVQKLYYIGPQFRRERPQKGRYRQFYQIGAEIIGPPAAGSESPARDAEVLEMLATLLDRLGIRGWQLELNSVGCANDRPKYLEALRKALEPVVGQMCGDCQRRAATNPLRVLDCKVPADQPIIEKLPRMLDYLDESCKRHFDEVQALLKALEIPFSINSRLVRGLDYYTLTVFEFTHGALGSQNAILGGGRYDGLSELLGGPKAPGIGFAIGEDRLVMTLSEAETQAATVLDVYIAPLGAGMNREAARLGRELRAQGIVVELGDEAFKLKRSLEIASKLGARYAAILGENEVASGKIALKNLASGEQAGVSRAELAERIHRH